MKIEEGKFYKTRDGQKKGPMKYDPADRAPGFCWVDPTDWAWNGDGQFSMSGVESSNDLVAEWTDEPRPWGEWQIGRADDFIKVNSETTEVKLIDGDTVAYRVKPEPVVETVTFVGNAEEGFDSAGWTTNTHRITFTTKDGEPDCGSIKMEWINV